MATARKSGGGANRMNAVSKIGNSSFADIDAFWDNASVGSDEGASRRGSLATTSPAYSSSEEDDFSYATSSAISESDLESDSTLETPGRADEGDGDDASVNVKTAPSRQAQRRKSGGNVATDVKTKTGAAASARRSSVASSVFDTSTSMISSASRLSSTLPLEDEFDDAEEVSASMRSADLDASTSRDVSKPNSVAKTNNYFQYDTTEENVTLNEDLMDDDGGAVDSRSAPLSSTPARSSSSSSSMGKARTPGSMGRRVSFGAVHKRDGIPSDADMAANDSISFDDHDGYVQSAEEVMEVEGDADVSAAGPETVTPHRASGRPEKAKRKGGESEGTPASSMKYKPFDLSTPATGEFARGRRLSDASFHPGSAGTEREASSEDEEEAEAELDTSAYVQETSFLRAAAARSKAGKAKGGSRLGLGLGEEEDEDDLLAPSDEDEDEAGGVRRSRRVTKGQRFQFWKNERPVYQQGKIIGLLTAEPTPHKPKRKRVGGNGSGAKKLKLKQIKLDGRFAAEDENPEGGGDDVSADVPIVVPPQYKYLATLASVPGRLKSHDGKDKGKVAAAVSAGVLSDGVLRVWDDVHDTETTAKVVACREALGPPAKLPVTGHPSSSAQAVVGSALQTFHCDQAADGSMSGFIAGIMYLPPRGIKDAEGVGVCAQLFAVAECQPGALEIAIADPASETWTDSRAQRVLVARGDAVMVPPGNIYRIENHSSSHPCTLYWTIIKPIMAPAQPPSSSSSSTHVGTAAPASVPTGSSSSRSGGNASNNTGKSKGVYDGSSEEEEEESYRREVKAAARPRQRAVAVGGYGRDDDY